MFSFAIYLPLTNSFQLFEFSFLLSLSILLSFWLIPFMLLQVATFNVPNCGYICNTLLISEWMYVFWRCIQSILHICTCVFYLQFWVHNHSWHLLSKYTLEMGIPHFYPVLGLGCCFFLFSWGSDLKFLSVEQRSHCLLSFIFICFFLPCSIPDTEQHNYAISQFKDLVKCDPSRFLHH